MATSAASTSAPCYQFQRRFSFEQAFHGLQMTRQGGGMQTRLSSSVLLPDTRALFQQKLDYTGSAEAAGPHKCRLDLPLSPGFFGEECFHIIDSSKGGGFRQSGYAAGTVQAGSCLK